MFESADVYNRIRKDAGEFIRGGKVIFFLFSSPLGEHNLTAFFLLCCLISLINAPFRHKSPFLLPPRFRLFSLSLSILLSSIPIRRIHRSVSKHREIALCSPGEWTAARKTPRPLAKTGQRRRSFPLSRLSMPVVISSLIFTQSPPPQRWRL